MANFVATQDFEVDVVETLPGGRKQRIQNGYREGKIYGEPWPEYPALRAKFAENVEKGLLKPTDELTTTQRLKGTTAHAGRSDSLGSVEVR